MKPSTQILIMAWNPQRQHNKFSLSSLPKTLIRFSEGSKKEKEGKEKEVKKGALS